MNQGAKLTQDLPKTVLKDLDEVLATEATGLGADRFGPRFIKSLPQTGRQMFVDFPNECEEKVVWPWQVYHCSGNDYRYRSEIKLKTFGL